MAKKSAFDIKSMLNSASMEEQTQKRKKIHYKQLVAHEKNHYSLEGIEDLADSIENVGLLSEILVKPTGEKNEEGKDLYTIVSGHRRVLAITKLVEERGLKEHAKVPCVETSPSEEETITELKLHYANTTAREMSPYDKMMAIAELKRLIQKAKSEGIPIKGRIKELVGEAVGLKPTQTQAYMTVAENSSDEVKEAIKAGELTVDQAYALIKENKEKAQETVDDDTVTVETPADEKPAETKPVLEIEHVENAKKETPREKLYKKLIGLEKAFKKMADEFDDYEEIEELFKQLESRFE